MAQTIVRQTGGTKTTITNRKATDHSPSGEKHPIHVGPTPKKTY
jgi:hypothetical protein